MLLWATVNEELIKEYEVQASTDGVNFIVIGRRNAMPELKNSSYQFNIDQSKFSFFRIRAISNNGEKHLSKVLKLKYLSTLFIKEFFIYLASLAPPMRGLGGLYTGIVQW